MVRLNVYLNSSTQNFHLILELCCNQCKSGGKHKGHNVLSFRDSKGFLKEKLEPSIKAFENNLETLKELSNKAKDESGKINKKKNESKSLVQKHFDEIRKKLNEKESNMKRIIENTDLGDEEIYDLIIRTDNIKSDILRHINSEKEAINDLDTKPITLDIATKIISAINRYNKFERLKEEYHTISDYEILEKPNNLEEEKKLIINSIETIGDIEIKKISIFGPQTLACNEFGPFFASFGWERDKRDDDKYIVSITKEGEEGYSSPESYENTVTVTSLEPNTTYNFRVRAERGGFLSRWSDTSTVKTTMLNVENVATILRGHYKICDEIFIKSLDFMRILTEKSITIISNINHK